MNEINGGNYGSSQRHHTTFPKQRKQPPTVLVLQPVRIIDKFPRSKLNCHGLSTILIVENTSSLKTSPQTHTLPAVAIIVPQLKSTQTQIMKVQSAISALLFTSATAFPISGFFKKTEAEHNMKCTIISIDGHKISDCDHWMDGMYFISYLS